MYSRYHNNTEKPIQLPENYSGCAFSDFKNNSSDVPSGSSRRIDVAKPTPPPEAAPLAAEPPPRRDEPAAKDGCADCAKESGLLPVPKAPPPNKPHTDSLPLGGLLGNLGHAFPFTHGIGFDEILLIGLILLLAKNENDTDLILWLALLLFCG